MITSHKDLVVWQRSINLTVSIYQLTEKFPGHERFGISSQMRRSAVSVASNIAEGSARKTSNEFLQFLHIARGSLSELETQLEISSRIGWIVEPEPVRSELECVGRMLSALIKRLRSNQSSEMQLAPEP